MSFSITSITEIEGKQLCSHCGEETKVRFNDIHLYQEDEFFCECIGAQKEKEIRETQEKLKNEINRLEQQANDLLKENEPSLHIKLYAIELSLLQKKYRNLREKIPVLKGENHSC